MLIHLAVFLITLSGLIFEIGLTRIYSATIWYHFAFIAVSVALLGWGLGGFALHTFQRQLNPTLNKAAVLVILYAATIVICLGMIVEFPFGSNGSRFISSRHSFRSSWPALRYP